ncbi:hypothetical protein LCGC14_1659470, partial [marine sediment metagenome]
MAERKGRWEVLEQSCGCCGVKNAVDGREWGYPMAKPAAEAVADFANWLEREQSLDKQPEEVPAQQRMKLRDPPFPGLKPVVDDLLDKSGTLKRLALEPDVVREVCLADSTYEVQTLASSEEFKAALDRGDHLVYARRELGGLWDYIVEKFPEE